MSSTRSLASAAWLDEKLEKRIKIYSDRFGVLYFFYMQNHVLLDAYPEESVVLFFRMPQKRDVPAWALRQMYHGAFDMDEAPFPKRNTDDNRVTLYRVSKSDASGSRRLMQNSNDKTFFVHAMVLNDASARHATGGYIVAQREIEYWV